MSGASDAALARQSIDAVQRRVVKVLAAAQVFGGIGAAAGAAVGALLAADLATESLSGLSSTASVIGTAFIAVPVSRVMNDHGRRPGLLLAYAIGVGGALLVVLGAILGFFPVALAGLFLTGGGYAAGLQSRYAAADLASPDRRGRDLASVVWATTIGSVLGPNLADPMGNLAERIGVPSLAGPYLLTVCVFIIAGALISIFLRPDPLLLAHSIRAESTGIAEPARRRNVPLLEAFVYIRSIPAASLGLMSMAIGQSVMVAVMSMTPVHLKHGDADLRIIGFVISGHITGMYIASPLVGWAVDRFGRRPIIILGGVILLAAFMIAGTASGHQSLQLGVGLFLLGLGWSCTLIGGSTLLTESLPADERASMQGAADLLMGISGAAAGLTAGLIVGLGSYAMLNVVTILLVVPLIILAVRHGYRVAPEPV
ncbi:MAG: MFS transporter [Thermomicrobiales bacterium]|nr:MFS transporter [Thermomicrobiales bacterium]